MKSAEAIALARQIAASCDTELGPLMHCTTDGAGADAHQWNLVFKMVAGPRGWLWAFALNDLGQPQIWIAHHGRRSWTFSLRTLLVAVTLAACWLGYQFLWIKQRHTALEQEVTVSDKVFGDAPSVAAPISLRLFGESGHWVLVPRHSPASNADVARWRAMFPEAIILERAP